MTSRLKMLALAAALAAGSSGAAMAQYYTAAPAYPAPGYGYAPNNPVSGAFQGEAAGAANGAATGGPVGAVVGGAVGLATGTVAGTANAVTGAPMAPAYPGYGSSMPPRAACPPGYMLYSNGCYPAR